MLQKSKDDGLTWDKPVRLPAGYLGPVKNKPIELANGTLLCGSSLEDAGWRVQMESYVQNRYWSKTKPLNSPLDYAAIQPTLLAYPDGSIQTLCRTKSGRLTECWSHDGGKKWSRMKRTQLPNPNAGVDGTVLADGRALLVYNHTRRGRSPLNVSVSTNGKTWEAALVLEKPAGRVLVPGSHPDERRQRARDLHAQPHEHQTRRHRPGQAGHPADRRGTVAPVTPRLAKRGIQQQRSRVYAGRNQPARRARLSHAALPGSDRLRVGLAWAGNPHHKNDANRSIAWEQFATLTELDGVDFFSLQVGPRAADCAGSEVVSLEGQLNDVAATAAVIEPLDLVITVDTAVAHLAGALGKPTWVLITAMPDWRWQLKPNRQLVVFAGEYFTGRTPGRRVGRRRSIA